MKKVLLFLSAFIFTLSQSFSQPTITFAGNAPQVGDVFNLNFVDADGLSEGASGAGQTWNYSGVTVTESNQTSVVAPSSTPFGGEFPDADAAFSMGSNSYSFAEITTSYMENVGVAAEESGFQFVIHYTDPVRVMNYPFNYGDSYSDTYRGSYTMQTMTVSQSGDKTFTADAHGTLITPEGTFNNILRIKSNYTQVDSFFMGAMFLYANTETLENYAWYSSSSKEPLFDLTYFTNSLTGTDTTAYYSGAPAYVTEPLNTGHSVHLYPVPAEDKIYLSFSAKQTVSLNIYDISGRNVYSEEGLKLGPEKTEMLNLSKLTPGTYFIQIHNQKLTLCRKFLKK